MNVKQFCIVVSFLIVLMVVLTSNSISQKIEIKDGVRIVHNDKPIWGDEPKIELEYDIQIGGNKPGDDRYTINTPTYVNEDHDRNIYVLDSGSNKVKKYSTKGTHLQTLEIKVNNHVRGKGTVTHCICFDINDNLFISNTNPVFDRDTKLIVLDKTGSEKNRIVIKNRSIIEFHVLKNGNIINLDFRDNKLISVYNRDGSFKFSFGKRRIYEDKSFSGHINYITIDRDDNIYMVCGSQNRLEKYNSEGTLLFKSDRILNYEETIEGKFRQKEFRVKTTDGRIHRTVGDVPDYNLFSIRIGVDLKGRVWTITRLKQPEYESGNESQGIYKFEIFDSEGILLGYLDVPVPFSDNLFTQYFVCNDRIYFAEYGDDCIHVYKIIEK